MRVVMAARALVRQRHAVKTGVARTPVSLGGVSRELRKFGLLNCTGFLLFYFQTQYSRAAKAERPLLACRARRALPPRFR